jgi:pyridoxine 5-phosphate synthase
MNPSSIPRLGVNIDHVATLRNARGGLHPDPVRAAITAARAGADGITAHLREDRRHIRDEDVPAILTATGLPLNLEMAATDEMAQIALRLKPHAVCLVPERRQERTTEGGLDVAGDRERLALYVPKLAAAAIRVSLFIGPEPRQIRAARDVGAQVVELHTGAYADAANSASADEEFGRLRDGAALAAELGLEVHAGHGLTYDNVPRIAALPQVKELNIGHFLIGEALFVGLDAAIRQMRERIAIARAEGGTRPSSAR